MKILKSQIARLRQIAAELDPIQADMQRLRTEDEALLQRSEANPADVRRAGEIALLLNICSRKLNQLQIEQGSINQVLPDALKKDSREFQKFLQGKRQQSIDRAMDKLADLEPDRKKLQRILEQGSLAGLYQQGRDITLASIQDGIGREAGLSWLDDAERFVASVEKITAKRGFSWT